MDDSWDQDFLDNPSLPGSSPVKQDNASRSLSRASTAGFDIRPAIDASFSDASEEDWDKSNTLKASATQMQALKQFSALKKEGQQLGKVQRLGGGAGRTVQSADWDQDFDLLNTGRIEQQSLKSKASFSSVLSVGEGEDRLSARPPSRSTGPHCALSHPARRPNSSASSLASQKEEADEDFLDADFDLPSDLARVTLSASRAKPRAATLSSSSDHSRTSSVTSNSGDNSTRSKLFLSPDSRSSRPRTSTTTVSSSNSFSDFDNDDANFFDEIELPPYLGGPLTVTSASPQKADHKLKSASSKIDLKSLIAQNLKARLDSSTAPDVVPETPAQRLAHRVKQSEKRKHAERITELYEDGLIINEDSFSKARLAANTMRPTNRSQGGLTTPKERSRRKSGAAKTNITNIFSAPTARATSGGRTTIPQPSTSGTHRKISAGISSTSSSRNLSNEARTLRYKKSTPHLSSASIGSAESFPPVPSMRTLSRKQSMPSLSDNTASIPARIPRSHTPTSTYTQSARQRPPSRPEIPSMPKKAYLQQRELSASPTIPPARPSTPAGSAAALRLTMPTLSSRMKQRSISSEKMTQAADHTGRTSTIMLSRANMLSPSTSISSISSLTTPASSHILKRPRRSQTYGDGSELDAFDDLPTNKDKERAYTKAVQKRASSLNTIPGSPNAAALIARRHEGMTLGKRKKSDRRVMPQLIRNLNASATERVEGDMTWNPKLQKSVARCYIRFTG